MSALVANRKTEDLLYLLHGVYGRRRGIVCPACDGVNRVERDRKWFHRLFECQECRILYRYPSESPEEMFRFYQRNYRQSGLTTDFPSDAELERLMATNFSGTEKDHQWAVNILDALSVRAGAKVLDYGANWGYAVFQFNKAGFAASGFEISSPRAAFARKMGLHLYEQESQIPHDFDIVFSSHVLEHVPNPWATLRKQMDWLRPGGWLIAVTPNGSLARRQSRFPEFHRNWGKVHPVLLTDLFVKTVASGRPYYCSSDMDCTGVAHWNQHSPCVNLAAGANLFFTIKK